jgi:hypothetical protein
MKFNSSIRFYRSKNATKYLPETTIFWVFQPVSGAGTPRKYTNFNSCRAIKFGGNQVFYDSRLMMPHKYSSEIGEL